VGVREKPRAPSKTPEIQLSRARAMRHISATEVEKRLWQRLRNRQLGVKFRRQQPIGPYIADFVCLELGLIIELDGGQHTKLEDARRTAALQTLGFRILRFWNNDIIDNIEGVLTAILLALPSSALTPQPPLPLAGEGV